MMLRLDRTKSGDREVFAVPGGKGFDVRRVVVLSIGIGSLTEAVLDLEVGTIIGSSYIEDPSCRSSYKNSYIAGQHMGASYSCRPRLCYKLRMLH